MTKVSRVFQIMTFCLIILFFVEVVMLFSQIDLFPFIIIGVVCGLSIILKNSSDDFFYVENTTEDTKTVFKFIFIAFIDLLLFSCFLLLGINNIADWLLHLFNTSKIVRFLFYGLLFPFITSYFMSWFWRDEKPNLSLLYAIVMPNSMGTFYKIFFTNGFIGSLICVYWEDYFNIVSELLKFF